MKSKKNFGNIYSLESTSYFQGTVMYICLILIFICDTRQAQIYSVAVQSIASGIGTWDWIFQYYRTVFLVEVSGHKLESSQIRVFVWFSTLIFPFYKMLFMNRLEFSCFTDFFVKIFKTWEEYGFLQNRPEEGTVKRVEQNTWVFCYTYVQEFHLWLIWTLRLIA